MDNWVRVLEMIKDEKVIKDFDFDKLEDVHHIVGIYNSKTFPKKEVWKSSDVLFQRMGLGIFEFRLLNKRQLLEPREFLEMTKKVNKKTMIMICRCVEAHLQTATEIGTHSYTDTVNYSKTCGRCVLELINIKTG